MAEIDPWDEPLVISSPSTPAGDDAWSAPLELGKLTAPKPVVPQKEGLARLEMYPQAFASGVQTLLGIPGTLERAARNAISDSTVKAFKQTNPTVSAFIPNLPPGPIAADFAKRTGEGLQNHPELKPENALERYGTAVAGALPGAVLAAPLGPVMALTTTAGGAIASQAAHDFDPNNEVLPIVAGILGSAGTGWATSAKLKSLAISGAHKEYKSAVDALAATDKEIFASKNPDLAVKSPELLAAENRLTTAKEAQFAASHPGTVPPPTKNELTLASSRDAAIEAREQAARIADQAKIASRAELEATRKVGEQAVAEVEKQVGSHFDSTANGIGKAKTLDEAGTSLQAAARNWVQNVMPKKLAEASAPLEAAIPKSTPVPITNYQGALSKLNKDGGSLQGQLNILSSDTPKLLQKGLDARAEAAELTGEPLASPTWEEVRALRSRLGDAMANPKLAKGMDQSEISALYSAVTQDLGQAAKQNGAGDLWNAFNDESSRLYSTRDGVMSKLISTTNEGKEIALTPAQAAGSLVNAGRKGGTELNVLRTELPDAINEFSAYQLRSPQSWGKLSPEAKKALVPDEKKIAELDTSLGAQERAAAAAKAEFKSATQRYNDTVTAANTSAKEGNLTRLREVRNQQKAVDAEKYAAAQRAAKEDAERALELKVAREEAQVAKEAASKAAEKTNYKNTERIRMAKERVNAAKAALPPPAPNPFYEIYKNKGAIATGAILGNELIPGMLNSMHMSPTQLGTGLAVGAAVVPPLWNGVKATAKNPRLLGIPATGALAGQNALTRADSK